MLGFLLGYLIGRAEADDSGRRVLSMAAAWLLLTGILLAVAGWLFLGEGALMAGAALGGFGVLLAFAAALSDGKPREPSA